MGRNTYTSRQVIENLAESMRHMEKAMPEYDRRLFSEILVNGRIHSAEMDLSSVSPEMAFLLSVIMEMMKVIEHE